MPGFIGAQYQTANPYYAQAAAQAQADQDRMNALRYQIGQQQRQQQEQQRREQVEAAQAEAARQQELYGRQALMGQEFSGRLGLQQDAQGADQQAQWQRYQQQMQAGDVANLYQAQRDYRLADINLGEGQQKFGQEQALGQQRFGQQLQLGDVQHQQDLERLGITQQFTGEQNNQQDQWRMAEQALSHGYSRDDIAQQWQHDQQREQDVAQRDFEKQMAEGVRQGKLRYTPLQQQQLDQNQDSITRVMGDQHLDWDQKMTAVRQLEMKNRMIIPVPNRVDQQPVSVSEMVQNNVHWDGGAHGQGNPWIVNPKTGMLEIVKNYRHPDEKEPERMLAVEKLENARADHNQKMLQDAEYHKQKMKQEEEKQTAIKAAQEETHSYHQDIIKGRKAGQQNQQNKTNILTRPQWESTSANYGNARERYRKEIEKQVDAESLERKKPGDYLGTWSYSPNPMTAKEKYEEVEKRLEQAMPRNRYGASFEYWKENNELDYREPNTDTPSSEPPPQAQNQPPQAQPPQQQQASPPPPQQRQRFPFRDSDIGVSGHESELIQDAMQHPEKMRDPDYKASVLAARHRLGM